MRKMLAPNRHFFPVDAAATRPPPILIGSLRSISRACFAEYAPEPNPTTKTKDVVWFT
jgi:hypothetical protein